MSTKPVLFISHSHADKALADVFHAFLDKISRNHFDVQRSSSVSAIKTGTSWKDWIDDNIVKCDLAIVLLTESSVRGRWVLWEAGAVAGVQYLWDHLAELDSRETPSPVLAHRPSVEGRVRVLNFGVPHDALGPFASQQTKNGRDTEQVQEFAYELLTSFQAEMGGDYGRALQDLRQNVADFMTPAREALRYTPIPASEALVQSWLDRLDEALSDEKFQWVAASKRWINVAFLGIGRADAEETIDFRIHLRLAQAFEELGDRAEAIRQLNRAKELSPNDMLVYRRLGKLYRNHDDAALQSVLKDLETLDPQVFVEDREAIALRVGDLFDKGAYDRALATLDAANPQVVEDDTYLLNWRAISTLKEKGLDAALPRFAALERKVGTHPSNFWDWANVANVAMARGDKAAAQTALDALVAANEPVSNRRSAAKYFDEICTASGLDLPWRAALGL